MRLGYGTNSLGDVDPLEAVPLLAALGYESLAITLDRHTLDPFAPDCPRRVAAWRAALDAAEMARVIETGPRYLLDPIVKHEPTLVSGDPGARARRVDLLLRAVDLAADLAAGCVSLWSGAAHDAAPEEVLWERLARGLDPVLELAARRGVVLGFEPEPDMVIDTLARAAKLHARLGRPDHLRLTVDIGHLECMGERPPGPYLAPWQGRVVNVHVDDMLACRHEHLPLGAGDVDFPAVLAALAAAGYSGGLHVELPRQAHRWHDTARESALFLRRVLAGGG